MTRRTRLTRREALGNILTLIGIGGTGLAGALEVAAAAGTDLRPGKLSRLLAVFGDIESARVVGAEYLRRWPAEKDLDRLVDEVSSPVPGVGQPSTLKSGDGTDSYWAIIDWNKRRDFEAGRLAEIDGWLLSRTEARLCAIAAMHDPASDV